MALLSKRQQQIVDLVAAGYSDKEIAHSLGLSPSTVKTYLGRVYRVHGVRNRTAAATLLAQPWRHAVAEVAAGKDVMRPPGTRTRHTWTP